MKGIGSSAIAVVVTILVATSAAAEDASPPTQISRGEDLYLERCTDCHGNNGERRALGRSRLLNRLPRTAIVNKLRQYQKAQRIRGMKDKMKSGLVENDIESLAAYIRLFERQ